MSGKDFIWPEHCEYPEFSSFCEGRAEITRNMVEDAYRNAKEGGGGAAAAILSQALWPGCRLKPLVRVGEALAPGPDGSGWPWVDAEDETRDVEDLVESAYEDLISRRVPDAIEKLEAALYPDGVPSHLQVVEWFRYLRNSEPMPEGWELADSLQGTPHGYHARLIRKVA